MNQYLNYLWLKAPYLAPNGSYFQVPWLTDIPGFSFAKGEMGTMDPEGNIIVELQIADIFQGDKKIERGSSLYFDKNKKLQKIIPPQQKNSD